MLRGRKSQELNGGPKIRTLKQVKPRTEKDAHTEVAKAIGRQDESERETERVRQRDKRRHVKSSQSQKSFNRSRDRNSADTAATEFVT